jgi:hypothetical protein
VGSVAAVDSTIDPKLHPDLEEGDRAMRVTWGPQALERASYEAVAHLSGPAGEDQEVRFTVVRPAIGELGQARELELLKTVVGFVGDYLKPLREPPAPGSDAVARADIFEAGSGLLARRLDFLLRGIPSDHPNRPELVRFRAEAARLSGVPSDAQSHSDLVQVFDDIQALASAAPPIFLGKDEVRDETARVNRAVLALANAMPKDNAADVTKEAAERALNSAITLLGDHTMVPAMKRLLETLHEYNRPNLALEYAVTALKARVTATKQAVAATA